MAVNTKVASAYVDLVARTESFKKALDDANVQVRNFSRQMKQSSEEARGSIALLGDSIGVALPRHLRNFVAELPGVSKAMSAAFDTIAVIALIDVVIKAGEKVYQFIQKNEEAAKKNAEAWESISKPVSDVNRELALSNSRLEDTIAKMEKKPGDAVKNALLEAADAAQKLSDSLDQDIKKLDDLTSKQQSSMLDRLIGDDTGGDISRTISVGARKYKSISSGYDDVLQRAAGRGDWQNYNDTRTDEIKELMAALGPQIATLQDYLNKHQDLAVSNPNDPTFAKARQGYNTLVGLLSAISQQADHEQLSNHQAKDQQGISNLDAASKLDSARLKAMQNFVAEKEELFGKDAAWEADYWSDALSQLHSGTDAYQQVLDKAHQAQMASMESMHKQIEALTKNGGGVAPGVGFTAITNTQGTNQLEAAQARGKEIQAQAAEQYQMEADKIGLATGAVSRHQAALDEAAAHTKEYQQALQALEDQLAQLQQQDAFYALFGGDSGNKAKEQQVQNQITELSGKYGAQSQGDQQAVKMTTASGRVIQSLDDLSKAFNDTTQMMTEVLLRGLDEVNNELVKGLMGKKTNFGQVGSDVFQTIAKDALQKIEGDILKKFGIGGKADGSQSNPFYVKNADGGSGSGSSDGGGILGILNNSDWAGKLFGGKLFGPGGFFDQSDDGDSSSSAGGGGLASLLGGLFGGGADAGSSASAAGAGGAGSFSGGGDVMGGVPIMTSELGPEVFVPPSNGTIIPHSQAFGAGPTFHIDARGANDPAAVNAAVNRAMGAYLPHVQAMSVATQQDKMRRQPLSKR